MGKDIMKQRLMKDRALRKVEDVVARMSLLRKTMRKAACLLSSLRPANPLSVNVRTNRKSLELQRHKLERAGIDEDSFFSSYLRKR